jgi:hypothetical protein
MLDLGQLLPHGKRDAKLETKSDRGVINEVADMKVCVFFCGVLNRVLVVLLAGDDEQLATRWQT